MADQEFVHLHVHTEYSLLDGLSNIDQLVARAKTLNMPALAITDHGTMFGVMDFFRACKKAGVKPIIGMEAYLARRSMHDSDPQLDKRAYHLLLLAKNQTGYQNLLKIASAAQLEGFYYRPRIDREFLAGHAEGLVATSGCLAAQIPTMVMEGKDHEARELVGWYQDVFGKGNFYLELQQHDIPELETLNKWILDYRKSHHTDVPLLATNDVHYVMKDDADPHDTLLCIQTSSLKGDTNRLKMSDASYYVTSQQEMWGFFGKEAPEALKNTLKVAEMCEVDLDTRGYHLPVFPVPEGFTSETYLRYLCRKGLEWRFGSRANDQILTERMERELTIIHNMGFETYFLIVWDLCQYARHADIWWNVRGSGAGSLAAYCLGITNIDPIQNHLLFERFLNPGRVSMPDIDLDYPDDRRGEMISYTARKYGEDKVAAIITFGTMGAKAAVRDVGRALNVPLEVVNKAARLIPTEAKQKPLEEYVRMNPELDDLYKSDEQIQLIIDTAKSLQGVSRHASTHAAGVIVADKPLVDYLPLHRITGTDPSGGALKAVTQFPMETCESIGLLKIDFLGLSTLTIMRKACELIERYHGVKFTMDNIPYRHDDERLTDEERKKLTQAFELIGRGDTVGVFQVESGGMQQMLRGMRPSKFEHIIAAISLYRPGPMDYIPTYNNRMHGKEPVVYHHPKMEKILAETYGIMVYQEQLMQIAVELFGYTPGDADLMRRAVSKKKEKDLKEHKGIFVERGPEHGVDAETAEKIFADIEFFANYGFNKCLSGDTEIVDAKTGRLVRIEDLANGNAQIEETLTCDTETLRLKSGEVTHVHENGVKPVYRLKTQLGRQIEATINHPFYTFDGWRNLGELQIGDPIAVPRRISVEGSKDWADYRVIVLGHLLAEGNLCHSTGVYFYTADGEQRDDYVRHMEIFDNSVAKIAWHKTTYSVYSRRRVRSQPQGLVEWIKSLGLWGKDSYTKFIPDEVFELKGRQIALLVARMWEGDGHINEKDRSLFYATSSERMARQLQHLLLRLGIISRLRTVKFNYRDGRIGYQLFITGNDNLRQFLSHIATHFVSKKCYEAVDGLVFVEPATFGTKDVIPLGIKEIIRREKETKNVTWDQLYVETGIAVREFSPTSTKTKSGFTRNTVSRVADYFDSESLRVYADNEVYWDKVVSIEYVGEKMTYDLTVPGTHNFVANDIIVHNSHAADYAVICVQTAYLKAHYPAEYVTALLSVHRDDSYKIATFLEEARRLGIPILPPDVNHSMADFDIQPMAGGKRAIRFGLAAVKNAGVGPVQHILEARQDGPFKSLEDLCRRVDMRVVQKRALESLIKVGALDSLGDRAQMAESVDRLVNFSVDHHRAKEIGQMSLFGESTGVSDSLTLPAAKEVSVREMLGWEKELLGLYVTGRPTDKYRESLRQSGTEVIQELKEDGPAKHGKNVRVAGEVVSLRKIITKNGQVMAVAQLEDWHESSASIEVVLFPRTWDKHHEEVDEGRILMVIGKFDASRETTQIVCERVITNFEVMTADESGMAYDDDVPEWALSGSDDYVPDPPAWMVEDAPVWANGNGAGHVGDRGHEYDEETGEVSQPEPPPAPEMPAAVAPATQGAAAMPTPAVEPQLSAEGNGAPLSPYASSEEPVNAAHWLVVHFPRSEDPEVDRRRLRRLHGLLIQYPGDDRFTIVIDGPKKKSSVLEFPNHTTRYCEDLMRDLTNAMYTVEIFTRPDAD